MKFKHYLIAVLLTIGTLVLIGYIDSFVFGKLRNQIENRK